MRAQLVFSTVVPRDKSSEKVTTRGITVMQRTDKGCNEAIIGSD
jgi:hypothetical protein